MKLRRLTTIALGPRLASAGSSWPSAPSWLGPTAKAPSKTGQDDRRPARLRRRHAQGIVGRGERQALEAAGDEEFLRRAYLDVLGRIPNITRGDRLPQGSKDSGKRAKLVEYLLAHPDYPKNFATQWKVILLGRKMQAREVDANALTAWLRRQFAENRPWNEMAYDLLTPRARTRRTARSTSRSPT